MTSIVLDNYGPIISDSESGEKIYSDIKKALAQGKVSIDLSSIKSMATFNAKQIFGKLYIQLGAEVFFDKIELINASNDLKIIIRMGIQSALEESE